MRVGPNQSIPPDVLLVLFIDMSFNTQRLCHTESEQLRSTQPGAIVSMDQGRELRGCELLASYSES